LTVSRFLVISYWMQERVIPMQLASNKPTMKEMTFLIKDYLPSKRTMVSLDALCAGAVKKSSTLQPKSMSIFLPSLAAKPIVCFSFID